MKTVTTTRLLPAPTGDFRFAARFYGPKMPLVDGSYNMPRPVLTK